MDLAIFSQLVGYIFWPIILIGLVYFLKDPKAAIEHCKTALHRILGRPTK